MVGGRGGCPTSKAVAPAVVESRILTVRGTRVILDRDLAAIYGVEPRVLNQAVKRNQERFPPDFAFRLTTEEAKEVQRSRSQGVILKRGGFQVEASADRTAIS